MTSHDFWISARLGILTRGRSPLARRAAVLCEWTTHWPTEAYRQAHQRRSGDPKVRETFVVMPWWFACFFLICKLFFLDSEICVFVFWIWDSLKKWCRHYRTWGRLAVNHARLCNSSFQPRIFWGPKATKKLGGNQNDIFRNIKTQAVFMSLVDGSIRTPITSTIPGHGLWWLSNSSGRLWEASYRFSDLKWFQLRCLSQLLRCGKVFKLSISKLPKALTSSWQGMVDVNVTPDKKTVFLHQEVWPFSLSNNQWCPKNHWQLLGAYHILPYYRFFATGFF